MKTNLFAALSSTVVVAGVLAGCGVNPGLNTGLTSLSTGHHNALVADGNGVKRRFGYKLGHHRPVVAPGFNLGGGFTGNLPSKVDLRTTGKISPIYDQGQLGSCTAFAMGKGLRETLTNMSGATAAPVSALYVYYKERELENSVDQDSGATMGDGMKVLQNNGACLDSTLPYDINNFTQKPSAAAETEAANLKIDSTVPLADLNALKAQLASGKPAVFGFTVYESFMSSQTAKTGVMPMPKPNESVLGGHAVFIVGYNDAKKQLIIKNSWGDSWGDKGYFYMPYAYVTADKVDEIYGGESHN